MLAMVIKTSEFFGIVMMKTYNRQTPSKETNLLPTRQQLTAFLQSRGINPDQLKRMSAWEQVQLTKEYQQATKRLSV